MCLRLSMHGVAEHDMVWHGMPSMARQCIATSAYHIGVAVAVVIREEEGGVHGQGMPASC